jgi:hypothetical protein
MSETFYLSHYCHETGFVYVFFGRRQLMNGHFRLLPNSTKLAHGDRLLGPFSMHETFTLGQTAFPVRTKLVSRTKVKNSFSQVPNVVFTFSTQWVEPFSVFVRSIVPPVHVVGVQVHPLASWGRHIGIFSSGGRVCFQSCRSF